MVSITREERRKVARWHNHLAGRRLVWLGVVVVECVEEMPAA
jgi:hypothetical protein